MVYHYSSEVPKSLEAIADTYAEEEMVEKVKRRNGTLTYPKEDRKEDNGMEIELKLV